MSSVGSKLQEINISLSVAYGWFLVYEGHVYTGQI